MVLLTLILFSYSRSLVSSRAIERVGRELVTFIALSGDQAPDFSAIAGFIRSLGKEIARPLAQALFIREAQGLVGRELFAIDGVKRPSNAGKRKRGTRAEFERQAATSRERKEPARLMRTRRTVAS